MLGVSALTTNIVVTVKGIYGGRRPSTPPSSWRAQASPTRPEQPSLASVGCGMAAGAAFAHPRAADARVRPNFLTHLYRKCPNDSCNEPFGPNTRFHSLHLILYGFTKERMR